MDEKPTYYSIIPASVRYDDSLRPNEKLLYSEISVLCNKNGYCNAKNEYFAKLYQVHKNTISAWINNLKNRGYIGIKIVYKRDSQEIAERIIFLSEVVLREIAELYCKNHEEGINKIIDRYLRNHLDPINKKMKENNTSINNKNNNNKKEKNLFEIIEENFCRLLSPYEMEEIESWPDTKLTRYVIKETILKGIRNIKYISRILEDYRLNGITTIEQVVERENKRKNRTNTPDERFAQKKPISKWDEVRKRVEEEKRNERG